MLRDLVDQYAESRPQQDFRFEKASAAPSTVKLDPELARQAWSHALENTAAAANGKYPIRVRLLDGPNRCVVELTADGPPRESVVAMELPTDDYQRITGTVGERRGIDLATASRISALFGGSARLVVEPGRRATVVLDWPTSLPAESPNGSPAPG